MERGRERRERQRSGEGLGYNGYHQEKEEEDVGIYQENERDWRLHCMEIKAIPGNDGALLP